MNNINPGHPEDELDPIEEVELEEVAPVDIDPVLASARAIEKRIAILNHNIMELTQYGHRSRKFIRWLTVSIIFDIILSFGLIFTGFGLTSNQQALCQASQRSWDARSQIAEIMTKPSVLSPEAERLFPANQTESLRLQIAQANRLKQDQRNQLTAANGARPEC